MRADCESRAGTRLLAGHGDRGYALVMRRFALGFVSAMPFVGRLFESTPMCCPQCAAVGTTGALAGWLAAIRRSSNGEARRNDRPASPGKEWSGAVSRVGEGTAGDRPVA